jgi:hypothetical protein
MMMMMMMMMTMMIMTPMMKIVSDCLRGSHVVPVSVPCVQNLSGMMRVFGAMMGKLGIPIPTQVGPERKRKKGFFTPFEVVDSRFCMQHRVISAPPLRCSIAAVMHTK